MSNNVQNLKIYDIIEQLEELIDQSPKPKLGGGANKRTVDVEEVFDLLGDLKTTIPEDIRRANSLMIESQTMLDNAEEHAREIVEAGEAQSQQTIADAQQKADLVLQKAREEYERLIAEDEIYQEAQKRAQLLAMKAEYNANEVFENAKSYADDILADLERFLGEYRNLVNVNRADLGARARVTQQAQPPVVQPPIVQQAPQAPVMQQPAAQVYQQAPAYQQPVMQAPIMQQAPAMPQQRPLTAAAADPRARANAPAKAYDDDDEFYEDEEEEGRGFLFGLFKKKKHDDYDDDDDFEE